MKFAIDAHAIGQKLTGNEVYVRNLLDAFAALDRTSEFHAFVSGAEAAARLPNCFVTHQVSRDPWIRLGWELPRLVGQQRPDLLHVQYTAPLVCRAPVVVSVHDVSFLEHPEYFSRARAAQLRITVRRTVLGAARILCPSEFSRRSVERAYGIPSSRITVVPNAVSGAFRPVPREMALAGLLRSRGIAWPFVFTVGDIQPRKNHIGLIRAFEQMVNAHPNLPHHLVIAGKDTWFAPEVKAAAAASRFRDRIHFTGFVPDEDLIQLYCGCDVFAFPSFYEGFGIPILEAMACGRAVACSHTTAMPEVADSAALLFDPAKVNEISRALADLLRDAELRSRMERLGLARAAMFSWERAARQTLDVYYAVAGETRARARAAVGATH
jgi:glycosyltransferase involved in cell wall biosynthesis